MFSKTINFDTDKNYLKEKDLYPKPAKFNIPDWYKNLNHNAQNFTIKGCIPFLDTLTSGYILKIPTDILLKHNVFIFNKENQLIRGTDLTSKLRPTDFNLNSELNNNYHVVEQLGEECPLVKKNLNLPVQKILNPWIIKTPPGYSCLFLPPMNNNDDRFSIIPGIVDTDTFDMPINFPFIVNGDKYPSLNSVLEKGTPYVQVIPFKRDFWKMKIGQTNDAGKKLHNKLYWYSLKILHNYKKKFWNKKQWK